MKLSKYILYSARGGVCFLLSCEDIAIQFTKSAHFLTPPQRYSLIKYGVRMKKNEK